MPGNFGFSLLSLEPNPLEDDGPFDDGNDRVEEKDADSEDGQKRRRRRKFEGFVVPRRRKEFPELDRVSWLKLVFETDEDGENLLFAYDDPKRIPDKPKTRDELENLLINIHEGKRITTNDPGDRPDKEPRGETSLSVNGEGVVLVILELPGTSNLRFNRDGAAISTRQEDEEFFLEAGVLNAQDPNNKKRKRYRRVAEFSSRRRRFRNKDCRLAYFIVDATDKIEQGEDLYPYLFNIHLDMNGPIGGSGTEYYFPIIIDPSVRHPGGGG